MKNRMIAVFAALAALASAFAVSVAVVEPAASAAPAIKPDRFGTVYFHSPSGRYSCAVFKEGYRWTSYQVGCQGATAITNRTEAACRSTWGPAGMSMVLERDRARPAWGRFQCQNQGFFVGGTIDNRSGRFAKPVLPYGRSVSNGKVTCTMRVTGVTCRNGRTGHGFFISAQGHRGF